jgi:hypothetical protein
MALSFAARQNHALMFRQRAFGTATPAPAATPTNGETLRDDSAIEHHAN